MSDSAPTHIPAPFHGSWESDDGDRLRVEVPSTPAAPKLTFSFGGHGLAFTGPDVEVEGASVKLTCQDDVLGETYYLTLTPAADGALRVEYVEVHAVAWGKTVVMSRADG